MEEHNAQTATWPQFAIGLYDQLTQRQAEITYDFADFVVHVPSKADESATNAPWRVSGQLTITTRDRQAN